MKNHAEITVEYIVKNGFKILPINWIQEDGSCSCGNLQCNSPGKHPLTSLVPHGFKNATNDLEIVTQWFNKYRNANIGIATGIDSDILVLDIDPRNGGDESFEVLSKQFPYIEETYKVLTGGEGFHLYYKYPGNFKYKKELAKGIDIKSDGGYVIAPPSNHISGKRYKNIESQRDIKDFPEHLLDMIIQIDSTKEEREFDQSVKERLAESEIKNILNHISSMPGHHEWMKVVFGLTKHVGPQKAKDLINDWSPDYKHSGAYLDQLIKRSDGRIGIGTIICMAQQNGYQLPSFIQNDDPVHPNQLGEIILKNNKIITQGKESFKYQDGPWVPISESKLKSLAFKYDTDTRGKNDRRTEAVHYIRAKTYTDEIKWRSIPDSFVAFQNGILDLKSGEMIEHKPEYFLESVLAHSYIKDAECPIWQDSLLYWFEGREDNIITLQKFFGYCLMQHSKFKKALLVYGESNTGKSVIAQVLQRLIGEENYCCIPLNKMGDPRELAPIVGKMVNIVTELPERTKIAEGGFKQLVSTGDPLQINPKYVNPFPYVPFAKHIIFSNSLPIIEDSSKGVWNRLLIIECNKVITIDKRDPDLQDKLGEEILGILNWAVEGASILYRNNGIFHESEDSKNLLKQYMFDQNPVKDWSSINLHKDENSFLIVDNAWCNFNEWQKTNLEKKIVKDAFCKYMSSLGYISKVKKNNGQSTRGYEGYRLQQLNINFEKDISM